MTTISPCLTIYKTASAEPLPERAQPTVALLAGFVRLIAFSYLTPDFLLNKVSLLSKQTRRQLLHRAGPTSTARIFPERTVKLTLKGEEANGVMLPQYLLEFADRLVIQSVVPFKGRSLILEELFRNLPAKFDDYRVKLFANELSTEVISQILKRDLKFSDILLYNLKYHLMLKSTKTLRIYKSTFRQIFPKEMTNQTRNDVETMQLEEVDFRVKNSLFRSCDRLRALALSSTLTKPKQLQEISSSQIQVIALDNILSSENAPNSTQGSTLSDFLSLLTRQQDLQRLSVSNSSHLDGEIIKQIAMEMPQNGVNQTKVSLSTNGEACTLDTILDSGILRKAQDTFIACDHLKEQGVVHNNRHFIGHMCPCVLQQINNSQTCVQLYKLNSVNDQCQVVNNRGGSSTLQQHPSSSSEVILKYRDHLISNEKIGLYRKITVTDGHKGELRIVSRC